MEITNGICIRDKFRTDYIWRNLVINQAIIFVFSYVTAKCKDYIIQKYILDLIVYGCETWYLTLRNEHRLREIKYYFLTSMSTKMVIL